MASYLGYHYELAGQAQQFIATRHMVKARIKQAYDSYLEDLLGISNPDPNTSPAGETGQSKPASKKLFSFF